MWPDDKYHVGSEERNFRVAELAGAVSFVGTEIDIEPKAQPDRRSYRVDFALFWSPDHQPEVGL